MFDEPSSYLDIKQRLNAAWMIRSMIDVGGPSTYVLCVEHDLSVLDYLSDYICVLYGEPGAYGVVTMPFAVRDGINIFLGGFVPTENLRFRTDALTFKVAQSGLGMGVVVEEGSSEAATAAPAETKADRKKKDKKPVAEGEEGAEEAAKPVIDLKRGLYRYPTMKKLLKGENQEKTFQLHVEAGDFRDSEIIVCLGENGGGKTTLIRMLAGLLEPDVAPGATKPEIPKLAVSYKPQKISPKFEGSVRELLHKRIAAAYVHPQFVTDVLKPMKIESIIDQEVKNLSGGELQRVAMTICLGTPADIYLIDEPSAYLDSEQRVITAKMIKRFILHAKKTAFVVEHDFIMSTYLADRVIVFEGKPGIEMTAKTPRDLLSGMNAFLENLKVTFRRDPANNRPRINKRESVKDQEQKKSGQYFFMDSD
jgi:ATP-binding cassette subfamily E protein 1